MSSLSDAEYVIVGGGAVGCGVAYSLAKAGKSDILLVERAADVALATTSQGAGLCGQVRTSTDRTRLAMHSVATFRELQRDPDVRPDWNEVGSIRVALGAERAEEFRRLQTVAADAGLETELIDAAEAARRWPLMDFRAATAILWCPSDGYMTPYSVATSYEHQCKKMGVRVAKDTAVEGIDTRNGRVEAVRTSRGTVRCRAVINAAGAHAYHVAQLVGLTLPIVPVRHEYYVTAAMDGMHPKLPCFRVPELSLYGRTRDGGLLLGGWESAALNADPRDFPLGGDPPPVATDWPVLKSFEERFAPLCPAVRGADTERVGKGWPTFTPDGRFIIGESRRVKGFVMAGGCNAHGISGSAGIGRLLVGALLDPNPGEYVKSLSPDRFTETSWTWDDARRQAARVYETYYGV